eukprot:7197009-Pyramimonas_sp.AAC.1
MERLQTGGEAVGAQRTRRSCSVPRVKARAPTQRGGKKAASAWPRANCACRPRRTSRARASSSATGIRLAS